MRSHTEGAVDERQRLTPASAATDVTRLYPDRPALAEALHRLNQAGVKLDGASDHGVSEALYLLDPDRKGLELYRDRSEREWPRALDGSIDMYTKPLDVQALLRDR